MEKKTVTPKVVQTEGEEVVAEVLATSIVKIDQAFKKMCSAGLKRDAIVLLLHDHSGVGKPAIRTILNSMDSLRRIYTTR